MNNELQKHKTSDTIKWVLTLLAFILVGVMLTGIILGWFDKNDAPTKDETQVNRFGIDEVHNTAAMSLAVASTNAVTASDSYTVKATVTPTTARNKKVDWSVEFVNANADWAKGKTAGSYVKVTPSGTDNETATVTCLQAFGAQIKIVAKSNENAGISAYCVCEYYERISSVSGNFTGMGNFDTSKAINEWSYTSGGLVSGNGGDLSLTTITMSYGTSNTAYTIAENLHDIEVTLTPTQEFRTAMKAKYPSYESSSVTFVANNGSVTAEIPMNYGSGYYFPLTGMTTLSDMISDPIEIMMLSDSVMEVLCGNPDMCFMSVTVKIAGDYNDFTSTFKVKAKSSTLPLSATGLKVDKTTLNF